MPVKFGTGPLKNPRRTPDYRLENRLARLGSSAIAGVDEAGRGPLAGPVAAAAVIFARNAVPVGLADSKTLRASQREDLFEAIMASAVAVGVGFSPAAEIDQVNIRQATFAAMRRAVAALSVTPDHVLIDGRDIPPSLACPAKAIVKGDSISVSIAAASIVAKVTRDRLMRRLAPHYPLYGFDQHAGYPTARHRQALAEHGPCPFHRLSFGQLKQLA